MKNFFPVVPKTRKTITGLQWGIIFTTLNYSLLIPLKYNRGSDTGTLRQKVNETKKLIKSGKFHWGDWHVKVNLKGEIIDGNHRYIALKELGLPVNFVIIPEPAYNQDNPSLVLNEVSASNNVATQWHGNGAFLSALKAGEKFAIAIDKLRNENKELGLTPSRVAILVLKGDKASLHGKNQDRQIYCNDEAAKYMESTEFTHEFDFIARVMSFVETRDNTSVVKVKAWRFIKELMPLIWNNDAITYNLAVVYHFIKKDGLKFKIDLNEGDLTASDIRERVKEILYQARNVHGNAKVEAI